LEKTWELEIAGLRESRQQLYHSVKTKGIVKSEEINITLDLLLQKE
jgi:hypothetical protein